MRNRILSLVLLVIACVWNLTQADAEPRDFSLNAIGIGALSRNDFAIGMLEVRTTMSPHVVVTAAPAILKVASADAERQIRTALTLSTQLGSLQIENRNMLVFSDAGTTRYRNRLRLSMPVALFGEALRAQMLGEITYEQGDRGWFRNMYGVGLGVNVTSTVSLDAYWTGQDDRLRSPTSLFYVVITARVF